MSKRILWLVVSALMALSLATAACGPVSTSPTPAAPTKPVTPATPSAPASPAAPAVENPKQEAAKPTIEVPKYGGVLRLSLSSAPSDFDASHLTAGGSGDTNKQTNQELWAGDWAKGAAGGYGTNESRWEMNGIDRFDTKTGFIAESTKWTIDTAKNQGTIIYQIRQGVRYALNPASEASRLVGGRELTADDVIFNLKRVITDPKAYIYKANPELRVAQVTKTGPREVTVKLPLEALIVGLSRFGDNHPIYPPEVVQKYGGLENWRNSVGTGPFILTDYVAGSQSVMVRNPGYWEKYPVGPGKGNQLPYLDGVRYLVIPDASTLQAALRTGKIDQMAGVGWEDAAQLRKTTPALQEADAESIGVAKVTMTQDKPPFNDIRVRRAMMMAVDFNAILKNVYGGFGSMKSIQSFPFRYVKDYDPLYLDVDAPEFPESAKELYTYHPDKAKQLLKEAGYPNGFKTTMLLISTQVDYMAILKDYWSKVGVDVTLDVKENAVATTLSQNRAYDGLSAQGGQSPAAIFYTSPHLLGEGAANGGRINDPVINKAMDEIRITSLTNMSKAMGQMKELTKYVVDQAFVIPDVLGVKKIFWWPWIKNYSGEFSLGYYNGNGWAEYVWMDQALKKSMGY